MDKTGLYLLLVFLISACSQNGNNNAETDETVTQTVTQKDTSEESHGPKLLPVDEAARDTSFLNFRKRLLEAIYAKDEKYLFSVLDKNIKIGFGGGDGIMEFKKQWKPEDKNSNIWIVLERILKMGGTFGYNFSTNTTDPNIFMAPYIYSSMPETVDAFSHIAITGKMVPVLNEPKENADEIAKLSYEIVRMNYEKSTPLNVTKSAMQKYPFGGKEWYYIATQDSMVKGFVNWVNAYSPIGYRAIFKKQNDSWKLQALVAGD